jgi:polyisoprenoid-binding protein YceI
MKFTSKILALAAAIAGLASAASAAVETYSIDPVHSHVGFKVRHFVSNVPGAFTKFSGTIVVDRDNLENSSVEAVIDVGSIDTFNDHRDADLKTASYFDAADFGSITFKSTSWKKTGDTTFDVTGNLTIRDTTKPVVLNVTLLAFGPGMKGAMLSGWEASTTLNRRDFGVNGPAMLGKAIGDDVTITIGIEADLKAPDAAATK